MLHRVRSASAVVLLMTAMVPFSDEHVVEPGETLSEIAVAHETSVKNLAELNDIENVDLIWAGQVLVIPGTGPVTTVYVVEPGDTLSDIAAKFGVSVAAIAAANNLANVDVIQIGLSLDIATTGGGTTSGGGDGSSSGGATLDGDGVIHSATTHVVKTGETLATIAGVHGTTAKALKDVNGIEDADKIFPGQVLKLPGEAPWVCPLADAWYSNDWGFPRPGGRTHEGNDLFAPYGTPVFAPAAGTVEFIDGSLGGLQFWLTAYDGTLYIGTHLSAYGPSTTVAAGDVVGYIGDTGNAKGLAPHLHFEIHPPGMNAVNPYPTLQANGC